MIPNNHGHSRLRIGRVSLTNHIYLVTTVTSNRFPVFNKWQYASAASRVFNDRELLGSNNMLCWVLMPDHAHWLIQLGEGADLSKLIGKLKAVSAKFVRARGYSEKVRAPGFHDHGLRNESDLLPTARYIVANPLRAGITRRVGDYPYWNAVWLDG